MRLNSLSPNYQQNFKAMYRDAGGKVVDISQKAIDELETTSYIRKRVEKTFKEHTNIPKESKVGFIISDSGECLVVPANFGNIKYAGHATTDRLDPTRPYEIETTKIDGFEPECFYDFEGNLYNGAHRWGYMNINYDVHVCDPENAPKY